MITSHTHDDVRRYTFTWWRSGSLGYDVSVYEIRDILVDAAFPGVHRDFARLLRERRPAAVIVTHQHEDHAGNAELVGGGMPLIMSAATREALRTQPPMGLYRRFAWGSWRRPGDAAARALEMGSVDGLELIATPGHSPDHHIVWDSRTGTMFGGDLFLGVKVRVARPGEQPRRLVESLRRAAGLGPARFFDAHRGLVESPVQALRAKADWLEQTIARIDALASAGRPAESIRTEVLGPEPWTTAVTAGDLSKINLVRAVIGGERSR